MGILIFTFVLIATINFLKHKDKFIGFWLLIFFAAVFLTTSLSDIFWNRIASLRLLEFPWRFTALSSFAGAVIGAYVISEIKNKKIIYAAFILLLISSFFYTNTNVQNKRDDQYYYSFPGSTVYRRATSTIWSGTDPFEIPKNKISIVTGNGRIHDIKVKSNHHSFVITAESDVKILDNTFYFPGWRAEIDGKKTPIEFQDINHRGLITFAVPKGIHKVDVRFFESPVRLFANIISLATIALLIVLLLFRKKIRFFLSEP